MSLDRMSITLRGWKEPRNFLWGGRVNFKKPHLVSWNVVCLDKHQGGLVLRRLSFLNEGLLSKWIWTFALDSDCIWKHFICAKYRKENLGWRNFWGGTLEGFFERSNLGKGKMGFQNWLWY